MTGHWLYGAQKVKSRSVTPKALLLMSIILIQALDSPSKKLQRKNTTIQTFTIGLTRIGLVTTTKWTKIGSGNASKVKRAE